MSKHKDIFDNESEVEDDFTINEDYAARYDIWRSKEEYEKLKARAAVLESSSDESSDEEPGDKDFGKPNNPEFDREFLLSLGTIYKHKNGEVSVKDVQLFPGDYRLEKEKEEKPMTLKEFEQHVMVERGGKYEENEIDTRKIEVFTKDTKKVKLDDGLDSDDEGDDDLLTSGLFKMKEDSNKEAKQEMNEAPEDEAVDFVKGVSASVSDSKHQDILETVKDTWNSDKLSKKDKWLVDFFLNKRYLADGSDDEGFFNETFLDEEEFSEEEEAHETDPLATQFKFRHEEPGDFIKSHPRSVPESIRQKDERRKERREATKQRQVMKKEEKRKEIELLKALKYKEIEEKIDKIKEVSGNEDIDLGEIDLEADFDPSTHDAYMERILGENYYDPSNVEEIPEFEDECDDTKVYDNWTKPSTSNEDDYFEEGEENEEENYYDEDCNMDVDNADEVVEKKQIESSTRRKSRRQSKFARALEKKKPVFDPKEKDFASYFDEYYKLDFEDIVAGIPCRFKYRKVESNNFGLTTGEILAAQNSDLNKWIGLKKIMQYNRSNELEAKERYMYEQRAEHIHIKQKILPSLFDENPEDLAEREREKRRMKNLKRKQKKWKLREGITGETENLAVAEGTDGNSAPEEEKTKNKNNKRPTEDSDQNLPRKKHILEVQNEGETINQPRVLEEENRSKKKKKKKAQIEVPDDKHILEEQNEGETINQPRFLEEDNRSKKKKKKKAQIEVPDDKHLLEEQNEGETINQPRVLEEDNRSKKKKKAQIEVPDDKHILEEQNEGETINQPRVLEEDNRSKKKKKKAQIKGMLSSPASERFEMEEGNTGEDTLDNNVDQLSVQEEDVSTKKKKRKYEIEEPQSTPTIKKKKRKYEIEEPQNTPTTSKNPTDNEKISHEVEGKSVVQNGKKIKKYKEQSGNMQNKPTKENPNKKRKFKTNESTSSNKRKNYHKKHNKAIPYFKGISDARLEAYGQNPKKLKNRVIYGKDF